MMEKDKNILIIVLLIVLVLAFFGGFGLMNLSGGQYVGYYKFSSIFWVISLIAAIWVIFDVLVNNKALSDGMKILWIICAVVFSIITAIIYYFFGRNNHNDLFRKNRR